MPHMHKSKAPPQKLCWILKAISSCGSSRNHFITLGLQLFAYDTCTGVHPHRGPPVLNPEDVTWKLLSGPDSPTSVGLPLVQKAPLPGRPDYTRAQRWIKKLDLCYYCVCVCAYVCGCVRVCGKPQCWSPHAFIMKDSAGCAAFCTSGSFIVVIIFS